MWIRYSTYHFITWLTSGTLAIPTITYLWFNEINR